MDYWRGGKGYVAPPPVKFLGVGPAPPPAHPLYSYAYAGKKLTHTATGPPPSLPTPMTMHERNSHIDMRFRKQLCTDTLLSLSAIKSNNTFIRNVFCLYRAFTCNYKIILLMTYRKNSKYWDTQTSYRSCP